MEAGNVSGRIYDMAEEYGCWNYLSESLRSFTIFIRGFHCGLPSWFSTSLPISSDFRILSSS